jgi:hypothetical protein
MTFDHEGAPMIYKRITKLKETFESTTEYKVEEDDNGSKIVSKS